MKIAIVHHQYAKKGGMETYLFDLLEGFSKADDKIEIVTCRIDSKNRLMNLKFSRSDDSVIKKINIPFFGIWRKFLFMRYINKNFIKKDYDLSLSLTRTASQDIAICGGTHLGYLHRLQKRPSLKDKIEIYFEQQSYLISPCIVVHSRLLQDEVINFYGIDRHKVHLVYPPLNTAIFNREVRQQRAIYIKDFAISSAKTTLLFPSTGHQRKGFYELLTAISKLPPDRFELIVVGSKPAESDSAKLPHVRYLGYMSNVDMAKLYAAVDFTILPSHYEPYGLVVVESLQCGTPVIISDQVGAKDFVDENSGIIFRGVTAAAIELAILKAVARSNFIIPQNFATTHGLTLEQHIEQLKIVRGISNG